jgi:hypothetical protein
MTELEPHVPYSEQERKRKAEKRAEVIRNNLGKLDDDIRVMGKHLGTAYAQGDWSALGYDSWQSYCEGEYGTHLAALHKEVRRVWTPVLREAGMNTGAIAAATGVDRKTIQRDSEAATNVALPIAPPLAAVERERRARMDAATMAAVVATNEGGCTQWVRVSTCANCGGMREDHQ